VTTIPDSPPGAGPDFKPTAGTAPMQPPVADTPGEASTHTVSGPPDVAPPGAASPFPPPSDVAPGLVTDGSVAPSFWEKCRGWLTFGEQGSVSGRCSFQS